MLAQAVPADRQASAQTLGAALSGGVGSLLAGVVGGHLADSAGYGGLFASLVAVTVAGTGVGAAALVRSRAHGQTEPTGRQQGTVSSTARPADGAPHS
jgi:hypothetical protein